MVKSIIVGYNANMPVLEDIFFATQLIDDKIEHSFDNDLANDFVFYWYIICIAWFGFITNRYVFLFFSK